ncbi:MAG: Short-chain-enoyl-CoA hydratase [Acidimicrobiales bacterium]|nr:Short-chain-enoyl-CoA hydratase [Acidimicrobiales bacterium]
MGFWGLERRDAIAVATFTRPPRNLMSMAAMSELEPLLAEVATDETVNVLVLTGGIPGYFIAHADLDDLTTLARGEQVDGDPASWGRALGLLESMPQPVVAAINGQAWGGGCEISLACTIRVAARSAHIGQPEVVVGIIPGAGGTQRLPRLIGAGRAADLILTGRVIDADEAERIGLVNAVHPDEGFLEAVLEDAGVIADRPRHAVVAAKRAMVEGLRLPLDQGLALEGELFEECQARPDTVELEETAAGIERSAPARQRLDTDQDR